MADFNLYWSPGNPYETGITQQVQYKKRNENSYTVLASLPGYRDSYQATGLDNDTLYNFRIANSCNNSYSPVMNAVSFSCPAITTFRDENSIDYSFTPDNDHDIDSYTVKLYRGGLFSTQEVYNKPFSSPVTGSFTGLDGNSDHTLTLVEKAGDISGNCNPLENVPVVCVSITDIIATTTAL